MNMKLKQMNSSFILIILIIIVNLIASEAHNYPSTHKNTSTYKDTSTYTDTYTDTSTYQTDTSYVDTSTNTYTSTDSDIPTSDYTSSIVPTTSTSYDSSTSTSSDTITTSPTSTPPPDAKFPTALASAKFTPDGPALKNGKMAGLLVFYQPADGLTSITGYLNNLLDDPQGNYTFTIADNGGKTKYDMTGKINPIFQLGGSSTFSTIQNQIRLTGDAAYNIIGSNFIITSRSVTIASAPIVIEFIIE